MNKKIIALIVVIILLAIIGGAVYCLSSRHNDSQENMNQTNTENQNANRVINSGENNVENEVASTNTNAQNEVAPEETTSEGKVLVLYFSQSGNTETVANFIHEAVGGDIIKLETVQNYPSDYDELVDYAQEEQKQNARPELKTTINNIDEYDTIFLGYPNWWGDMPMPIYTFLDNYDLSGKTIAPFITHGGSGLSGTPAKIRQEEPNATVLDGLAVSGSGAGSSQNTVNNWVSQLGF